MQKTTSFLLFFILLLSIIQVSSTLSHSRNSENPSSTKSILKQNFVTKAFEAKSDKISSLQSTQGPPPKPVGTTQNSSISINGDAQVLLYKSSGSGTSLDPYVIKLLNITQNVQYPLSIRNTFKPLIVEDCYFNNLNFSNGAGIFLQNVTNLIIKNNYFENVFQGVYGVQLQFTGIINNTIILYDNSYGLDLINLITVTLDDNYIDGGGPNSYLISIFNSQNSYIGYNMLLNTSVGIISQYSRDLTITNNVLSSVVTNAIEIDGDMQDYVYLNNITHPDIGVVIYKDFNCSITNNNITEATSWGIYLNDANINNIVQENYISNSVQRGIYLLSSSKEKIDHNNITYSGTDGIFLSSSDQNSISNNSIAGILTSTDDIAMSNSNLNIITHNKVQKALTLIIVQQSNWNVLSYNRYQNSYGNGTEILNSKYNSVVNSTFDSSTDFGIILRTGLNNRVNGNIFNVSHIYDIILESENDSTLVRNAFFGLSNYGGSQALDSGYNNIFLYNYWSSWTSPDENHDGIVDIPFLIDGTAHSYDLKPLSSFQEITNLIGTSFLTSSSELSNTTGLQPGNNLQSGLDLPFLFAFGAITLIIGLVLPVAFRRFKK